MNLASRCGDCGTLFRVVRDQLWISDGWVRCGQCSGVFNAFDQLYDLEQGKPPPWTGSEAPAASQGAEITAPGAAASVEPLDAAVDGPALEPASLTGMPPERLAGDPPEVSTAEDTLTAGAAPFADASLDERHDGPAEAIDANRLHPPLPERLVVPGEGAAEPAATPPLPMPDFVRRAEKQARWQRPRMRLALGALALVAAVALLLQTGLHFRDRLAAGSPTARRVLASLCERLACRIELPRRIDAITVESSALSRIAGDERLIRLSLTLRNRGRIDVAVPAIDLSLKDGAGKIVVRRAIRPEELPAAPAALPAGVDVPLQLLVSTGGRRIAGYTIEVFYP